MKRSLILRWMGLGFLLLFLFVHRDAQSQCAMCSLTAENATQNGNVQGKGLNNGILFLLAMPYLAALGIGLLWYTRFRKKKQNKYQTPRLTS